MTRVDSPPAPPPCLVVAHADRDYTNLVGKDFRARGWTVFTTDSAASLQRLAAALRPTAVVLDADLPDESGWLTCGKLGVQAPHLPVVLVSEQRTAKRQRLAAFVGAAAIVSRPAGVRVLAQEVLGAAAAAIH